MDWSDIAQNSILKHVVEHNYKKQEDEEEDVSSYRKTLGKREDTGRISSSQ